ncbi:hypothetical protein EJ05DRAFT_271274 [Pseudovirgaria hyperparasitica]|uniref:Aminoglycoside phosphotransferase domain-containing protein n=1 Tax=Pseudovirgaria hyperparasitica TaxID=470096 RepID=A0A6A6WB44_9PEZI|nr:uncharacterized protein EJ05DRAFT_271274 [Pseudovirgaria hyperparasitica]KAF2760068.1 hypothetical protein EJ05DRAFT_271274 [Pseudovirgaria hyperparasitica]
MVVQRKWGDNHINKSFKQIDRSTWLIGKFVLHRSPSPSDTATWNDDSDNSSYTLTPGDASAVWSIGGNAICKVRYTEEGVTPESVTLNFVKDRQPSFETPRVLHHAFDKDRSYLFIQRLQGRTLDTAWPTLNDYWKTHYMSAVVDACLEMTQWRSSALGGVDNQYIPEYFLAGPKDDFSVLHSGFESIGMDCSSFVFYHADLGPTNIIVEHEPNTGRIGIIDFEISGYFPLGWIRTKFRLSSGMNFSAMASDNAIAWRAGIQKMLEAKGFEDYSQAWIKWRGYTES